MQTRYTCPGTSPHYTFPMAMGNFNMLASIQIVGDDNVMFIIMFRMVMIMFRMVMFMVMFTMVMIMFMMVMFMVFNVYDVVYNNMVASIQTVF